MARLGRRFGTLWAANAVSGLGDGVVASAAPLLVASVTVDPVLVGLAVFVQQLPWLVLSLVSGVVVDRVDRVRLVVAVRVVEAVLTTGLALAVAGHQASLWMIYASGFLLGCCETLAVNASNALVPAVVASADLPRANARLQGSFFVLTKFTGPPLGAVLFGLGMGLPFGLNAASFALAAVLMTMVRGVGRAPGSAKGSARGSARGSVWAEVAEGVRWLWAHSALRMLTLTLCLMNVTLLAGFSIMVLYCREQLGLSDRGYGLLTTATAVGGLLGSALAPRLQARFGGSLLLRVGLVIESLTHVGLALAGSAVVAGPVLMVFGLHASVWNSVDATLRQRSVPDELRGRVQSVFSMLSMGGCALGSLIGGPMAAWLGVTGPFWVSAVVMGALTVVAWRPFGGVDSPDPGVVGEPALG